MPSISMKKKKVRQKTGELDFFWGLWKRRKHKCSVCGKILYEFNVSFFAHLLPKGRYPELRLVEDNVVVMCFECHYIFDHQTHKAKEDERFEKIFKMKKELQNAIS